MAAEPVPEEGASSDADAEGGAGVAAAGVAAAVVAAAVAAEAVAAEAGAAEAEAVAAEAEAGEAEAAGEVARWRCRSSVRTPDTQRRRHRSDAPPGTGSWVVPPSPPVPTDGSAGTEAPGGHVRPLASKWALTLSGAKPKL